MDYPLKEKTSERAEMIDQLELKVKELSASLAESDKVNLILLEKIQYLEKRIEEVNNNKANRIANALKKTKFMLATAGEKKNLISKLYFFLSPLGLKLIYKCLKRGLQFLALRILRSNEVCTSKTPYQIWMEKNLPTEKDLREYQKIQDLFLIKPLFSIIYLIRKEDFNRNFFESVQTIKKQIYNNWELIIVAGEEEYLSVKEHLLRVVGPEKQIKFKVSASNDLGELANRGLEVCKGDFVKVISNNDLLSPDCLYQYSFLINQHPEADLVYSDDDMIDEDGFNSPSFKPDWSPDTILSGNYIGDSFIVSKRMLKAAGNFKTGYGESFLYELVLRFSESETQIFHIDRVLFHKRKKELSTFDHYSDLKAISDTIKRRNQPAIIDSLGFRSFCIRYHIQEFKKISIIIPTKDQPAVLDKCLKSVFEKTTYPDFEVIVIDNNSAERKTFNLFELYGLKYQERFKVFRLEIPFNYSAINNYAVSKAEGDYLVFLNNDTEVITSDWLEGMVEQAQRPTIGAVGVKLLYPDKKIQHAGMVIGLEWGGNTFVGEEGSSAGYLNSIDQIKNYSAVTAACMMCRKEVFEEIGGFNEEFAVEYNDTDLCLRLREAGYNNLYLPHVQLYHYESLSRGYVHLSQKKYEKHLKESEMFRQRWGKYLEYDPFYNRNLSKKKGGFAISC